jgi:thymidylate synthase
MITDHIYLNALAQIEYMGTRKPGRNGDTVSYYAVDEMTFTQTPLVTLRKTAWKMAIREMEWFMSGDPKCPEELLPWWKEQLDSEGNYLCGYSQQFRGLAAGYGGKLDQIKYLLNSIREHPHSRRACLTTWHPWEMANITLINDNSNTPTNCHSSFVQLHVCEDRLHMFSYQRSADMLLGLPHNWIQSWALLLWFAYWANLAPGSLMWKIGDAHIYCEDSHRETLKALLNHLPSIGLQRDQEKNTFELVYQPPTEIDLIGDCPAFKADHFKMIGEIPDPSVSLRPKLL